jgi:hypothetical protein
LGQELGIRNWELGPEIRKQYFREKGFSAERRTGENIGGKAVPEKGCS